MPLPSNSEELPSPHGRFLTEEEWIAATDATEFVLRDQIEKWLKQDGGTMSITLRTIAADVVRAVVRSVPVEDVAEVVEVEEMGDRPHNLPDSAFDSLDLVVAADEEEITFLSSEDLDSIRNRSEDDDQY